VEGKATRRYFAQMAGAGLDARAIELLDWRFKKRIGPLAYVLAGLRAIREGSPRITVEGNGEKLAGELVLIGNGRLYGGSFRLFPEASAEDGQLEVCVFPRIHWDVLLSAMPRLLLGEDVPANLVRRMRASRLHLTSEMRRPAEVDGELAGVLPARVGLAPAALRVLVPASYPSTVS
jgi:diacylglycerol kinase family enzyme